MDYTSKSTTRQLPRSAKTQLIEFLQLLLMLAVIGGWIWAVINIHHTDDYYTDGTL
jgi:hypothetical protein